MILLDSKSEILKPGPLRDRRISVPGQQTKTKGRTAHGNLELSLRKLNGLDHMGVRHTAFQGFHRTRRGCEIDKGG